MLSVLFTFVVAALFDCSAASKASIPSNVPLPAPSGVYEVGLSIRELVDHHRTQPFAPHVEPRKLMISVFYPVATNDSTIHGEYMPSETARFEDLELAAQGLASVNGTFESLKLSLASKDATQHPSGETGCTYPVVIFMPAEGTTRLFYSLIASTVASNGYTVVTVDTPYDLDIVEYPDGSVALLNQTVVEDKNQTQLFLDATLAIETRAQDASFVLDSLHNATLARDLVPNLPISGLNTSHVAMFGHSLGGASALTTMILDDRVIGGLDMDGAFFPPAVEKGTDRPFMIMAHEGHVRKNSDPLDSWAKAWPNLTGWKRDIIVNGALHYDFSDYPIVFETLGITPPTRIEEKLLVGNLKGGRALKIVTSYVTAFLDFVVYGKPSALLESPVEEFPEITFEY